MYQVLGKAYDGSIGCYGMRSTWEAADALALEVEKQTKRPACVVPQSSIGIFPNEHLYREQVAE